MSKIFLDLLIVFSCLMVSELLFLSPILAYAGGPVHGARAASMATAFVGVADDPSAILHNPAGIAFIKGTHIYGGLTGVIIESSYTSPTSGSQDTEFQIFAPPHIFLSSDLGREDLAMGIGVYAPFGIGGRKWSRQGLTRYGATRSEIGTFEIAPVIAWKPTPLLSVAASVNYTRVQSKGELMMDQSLYASSDAELRLEGEGDGWGYRAGILLKPTPEFSLGASYRSKVSVDVDGKAKLTNIAPALQSAFGGASYETGADTHIDLPEVWSLGLSYRPIDTLLISFDLELVRWSSFDKAPLDIEREVPAAAFIDSVTPKDWNDIVQPKFGVEYSATDKVALRGGYTYLPTPVPAHTLEPGHPDSDQHYFSAGIGIKKGLFTIDTFYMIGIFEERKVKNSILSGKYESTIHFFGQSIGYTF